MRNWFSLLKFEQNNGGDGGGAGGGGTEPEKQSGSAASGASTEGEGDQFDELGYPKEPEAKGTSNTDPKGDDKKPSTPEPKEAAPEKVDPLPGYGDVKPPEKKEEPPAPKEEVKLDYELNLESIPKEESDKLKSFAKKHSLSKEVAQELADQKKQEVQAIADARKEMIAERDRTRAEWVKELKDDPKFGGEKYGHNVQQVGKLLQEHLPLTKKVLTERGTVLPPYVVRDLKGIADLLYSTKTMVQGDATVTRQENNDNPDAFLDDMYSDKKS